MKMKKTSFVLALSLALPVMALGGDGPAISVNYAGWYTLENPVGGDTLADIARQTTVLKLWLTYAK